jgi:hypothetical protein
MTNNTTRENFEKHTTNIHDGTLDYWKEDVKTNSSVKFFDETEAR